jgi:tRNA (uracil-5-)-methyltransferase
LYCKHFGVCGSCNLYNLAYLDELDLKKSRVLSALGRFGVDNIDIFPSKESHYRARAEFRIWHIENKIYYAMGDIDKNGVVLIDECPKVAEPIEDVMWRLKDFIEDLDILRERLFSIEFLSVNSGDILVTLIYHKKLDNSWIIKATKLEKELNISIIGRSRKQRVVLTKDYLIQNLSVDGVEYRYKYYELGFTQPNSYVNSKMIKWAVDRAKEIDYGDFLEMYCGLGNFTIPLSKQFKRVLATEISKSSIKSAKENSILNGVGNIEFIRLSSEELTQALSKIREFRRLKDIKLDSYNFSTVLIDPPRAGADKNSLELISNIDNIIYISCNLETLTRDLDILKETHNIKRVALFDQFPHTTHIESGVFLEKI